jgi:hypothetical protein
MEQSCPLIRYDLSSDCSCHFPGRLAVHIYNIENMVPQEGEDVLPIPHGNIIIIIIIIIIITL